MINQVNFKGYLTRSWGNTGSSASCVWRTIARARIASLLGTIAQEWENLAKREEARTEQEKFE